MDEPTITTSQPHQFKRGDRIKITGIKRPWWLFWKRSMRVTITGVSGDTVTLSKPFPSPTSPDASTQRRG